MALSSAVIWCRPDFLLLLYHVGGGEGGEGNWVEGVEGEEGTATGIILFFHSRLSKILPSFSRHHTV
jgi:hypothetical protein